MSNILGSLYRVISFGESHGPMIGCVIDGCPSGISLDTNKIQINLNRRRPGTTRYVTQRNEPDKLTIVSGILNNITTGTPIGCIVNNIDQVSADYSSISLSYRPGHADFTYFTKYGLRDYRGGGRTSARVTIALVIAGSLAKQIIKDYFNTLIFCYVTYIGSLKIPLVIPTNSIDYILPIPDLTIGKYLSIIIKKKDSIGATLSLTISNLIPGIGDPLFNKFTSALTTNLTSLNAVKSVEFGTGKYSSKLTGSINNDLIHDTGFLSNNSGGVLGGITTGQDVKVIISIKPTSSISRLQQTITTINQNTMINIKGRHDPCVGIRALPIIEAISAITIIDLFLSHRLSRFF